MQSTIILILLSSIVFILLIVGAPFKSIRFIGHFVVKLVIGVFMLFIINVVGVSFDIYIPINGVTAFVSGILGVPGVAFLIAVQKMILF